MLDMMPLSSYEQMLISLTNSFESRSPQSPGKVYRMAGILFARPTLSLAQSSIVPNLDYFHHRSGKNIDFFCAGYEIYPDIESVSELKSVTSVGDSPWTFSNREFNKLRERFEQESKWQYRGGVELILTNVYYDNDLSQAVIEWESSIVCNLDRMVNGKAIESVESFFEDIFRYAEKSSNTDPTWGFSGKRFVKTTGSALKQLILSLLPKNLGADLERLAEFAVVDLSKAT